MSTKLLTLSFTATLMGGVAFAEAPQVAVDIAPVHSLVARVMEGVGTPDLVVQPGASPHEYSLRPSEAAALQEAALVFWVGPDLTPWLTDAIETLAPDAALTTLLDSDGTIKLEFRESALFEAHDHDEKMRTTMTMITKKRRTMIMTRMAMKAMTTAHMTPTLGFHRKTP